MRICACVLVCSCVCDFSVLFAYLDILAAHTDSNSTQVKTDSDFNNEKNEALTAEAPAAAAAAAANVTAVPATVEMKTE